ncbi:MAG TPA: hypothetical protein PLO51_03055 [Candidatus Micrarchaeota archaeon]|nr:hypothetical protein [Candidatus Micrarchaeota archaeon]
MPFPKNRSRSVRRIKVRTMKGSTTRYERRDKEGAHLSAFSGKKLQAVTNARAVPKSMRRPNRMFAGALTAKEAQMAISFASRVKEGTMKMDDVDIELRKYVLGAMAAMDPKKAKKPRAAAKKAKQ